MHDLIRKLLKVLFAVIVMIGAVAMVSAADIVKGPYLQNVTPTSITICWENDRPESGLVEYATVPGGSRLSAASENIRPFHEVTLSGLSPSTDYRYKVSSEGDSAVGTFRTAPKKHDPFTFIAYGDSRSGHAVHKILLNLMMKRRPALILNSGDLVGDGRKQEDWDVFWGIVGPVTDSIPYYPCLGNHEKNSALYYKYFSLPEGAEGERYYSFSYGGAFFIILDPDGGLLVMPKQKKWLKEQLRKAQAYDFIFAMFHYPPYSSSKREPLLSLRRALGPVFERYKVTAVFNGHDHFYERSEDGSVTYIVTGGGGAPLYDHVRDLPESRVRSKTNHFVAVKIDKETAAFDAVDASGKVFDSFSIQSPR
ncbi:metallophosphoesterase [bacterium]